MLAPTLPHRPVVAHIKGTDTPNAISVLKQHGKFPMSTQIACVPMQYEQDLGKLGCRDMSGWSDAAERQLCALYDVDEQRSKRYQGRGRGPQFVMRTPREIWTKEHEMRFSNKCDGNTSFDSKSSGDGLTSALMHGRRG
eukprot:3899098-Amphidinium_carterae.3